MEKILHHYNSDHNINSAKEIVPYLLEYFYPQSVIDVGCGLGQWLYVFKEYGIENIIGLDGAHVPIDKRMINEFLEVNLNRKFLLSESMLKEYGKFDLCICLEVAEHLPEEEALPFIDFLVSLSDVVLFSAAIPNQTGENHLNEQFFEYWINLFRAKNYECLDIFRKQFWENENVNWWYRQNMFLYVKKGTELKKEKEFFDGNVYIHPGMLNIWVKKSSNKKCSEGKKPFLTKLIGKVMPILNTHLR